MLFKIIRTEFEATQQNLGAVGLTQQKTKQQNLGQRNGNLEQNNRIWETAEFKITKQKLEQKNIIRGSCFKFYSAVLNSVLQRFGSTSTNHWNCRS